MANKKAISIKTPLLSQQFGTMELRKMNEPFEFENPNTKIKSTTTKVKVLLEDFEDDLSNDSTEMLEITLEGAVPNTLFKKGLTVDFVNASINIRTESKVAFGRADAWLDMVIRAEKMVIIDPETGEVKEMKIVKATTPQDNKEAKEPKKA